MIYSLTYYNSRHINIEKTLKPVQRIYRKLNLPVFTKWTRCGVNCITGNVARVWCMWRVKVQIFRTFSAHEHDTYATISISALLWKISFTKYVWVSLYTIYLSLIAVFFSIMCWVSHLINQNYATTFYTRVG